ncbi:MAG: tetratricopeptide repeat protein [Acidobacteriota bacterium]|nr:MAG: tetratricopeptide repeat protein [Acidobacteriota bacterium]
MCSLRVLAATIAVAPFFVGAAAMKPMWQTPYGLNKKGNALYEKGDFEGALEHYDEALVLLSESPPLHFNRGNAFFRDQKLEEALEAYAHAFEESDPGDAEAKATRQAAAYNAGNTLYESEKYSEALEAYREALRLDTGDLDAKRNYELALQQMQSCQRQEGEEGEENEEEASESQEGEQQEAAPDELTEEEAQRLLEALRQHEQEALEELEEKKRVIMPMRGLDW